MLLFSFFLVFFLLCLSDGISLYINRRWKELITVGVMVMFPIITYILCQMEVLTLLEVIHSVLRPLGETIFNKF